MRQISRMSACFLCFFLPGQLAPEDPWQILMIQAFKEVVLSLYKYNYIRLEILEVDYRDQSLETKRKHPV